MYNNTSVPRDRTCTKLLVYVTTFAFIVYEMVLYEQSDIQKKKKESLQIMFSRGFIIILYYKFLRYTSMSDSRNTYIVFFVHISTSNCERILIALFNISLLTLCFILIELFIWEEISHKKSQK